MQKPKNTITKDTLKKLRGDSSRERLLHRLHCVAMTMNGSSASEAARIFGDSPRAVAYWVTQFKQHGIEGLEEDTRPGRPSQFNEVQIKQLQRFLNQCKRKSQPVKASTLATFILKELGISLPYRQCWRILKRLTT